MKKVFFYLIMSTMLFTACSNDEDTSTPIQEESVSTLYSFDNEGKIVVSATDDQKHTMKDFEDKVCGSYWKIVKLNQIMADGTVSKENYSPEYLLDGIWTSYIFHIDKKNTVVYFANDSYPRTRVLMNGPTSYDEKTGTVKVNDEKLLTIISINSNNTITAINWQNFPNEYGDYVQLTLQPLSEDEIKLIEKQQALYHGL